MVGHVWFKSSKCIYCFPSVVHVEYIPYKPILLPYVFKQYNIYMYNHLSYREGV